MNIRQKPYPLPNVRVPHRRCNWHAWCGATSPKGDVRPATCTCSMTVLIATTTVLNCAVQFRATCPFMMASRLSPDGSSLVQFAPQIPCPAHPPQSADHKICDCTLIMFPLTPIENESAILPWKLSVSGSPSCQGYRAPKTNCVLLLFSRSDKRVWVSISRGAEAFPAPPYPILIHQGNRQADLPQDVRLP